MSYLKKRVITKKLYNPKRYVLVLTVVKTKNNFFCNCRLNHLNILNWSLGQQHIFNSRKKLIANTWLMGHKIKNQLLDKKFTDFFIIFKNISLQSQTAKYFLKSLSVFFIKIKKIKMKTLVSYNGCRKKKLGRTGRKRKIFF